MGTFYNFECQECDYSTSVSGGRDTGIFDIVQTMVCSDCQEVVDVLIGACGIEGATGYVDFDKDLGCCPKCRRKNLREWNDKRTCPKCGEGMRKDFNFTKWH